MEKIQNRNAPLCIALPKQGRLKKEFDKVMRVADFSYKSDGEGLDRGMVFDSRGEFTPFRGYVFKPDDAFNRLEEEVVNVAVGGLDALIDFNCRAGRRDQFDFDSLEHDPCELWVAAEPDTQIKEWADLANRRIATKYTGILKNALEQHNVGGCRIVPYSGGSEGAIEQGNASAILDIVASGKTLRSNGLTKCFKVLESSTVIVRRGDWREGAEELRALRDRLMDAAAVIRGGRPGSTRPSTLEAA